MYCENCGTPLKDGAKCCTLLLIIGLGLLTACGLWQPKPPVGDDLLRCRVWAVGPEDKLYYFDKQGFLAPDTIAFDGFSTAADGSWDETKPRVKRD